MIGVFVESYIPDAGLDCSDQMRRLGRHLKWSAGESRGHFQPALRFDLDRRHSATIDRMVAKLERYSGKCSAWEADVQAFISALRDSAIKEDAVIPVELVYSHGIDAPLISRGRSSCILAISC